MLRDEHGLDRFDRILPLRFHGYRVRVVQDGDREQWVAKDVCRALGLGNVTEALRGFDDDERGSAILNTPGGAQEMATVTEPGLYKLIFRSRKGRAKAFTRWVTREVLPQIRRTGFYVADGDEARVRDVLDRILRHKTATWEQMWSDDIPAALAPIYGTGMVENQYPVWMAGIMGRIYEALFGQTVVEEARKRRGPHTGKGNLIHQYLTDDARKYLKERLFAVEAFAKTSRTPEDFWRLIEAASGERMVQLRLFAGCGVCPECGFVGDESHRFCARCGARLEA